jgi:sugar lactone lactonase YvrE
VRRTALLLTAAALLAAAPAAQAQTRAKWDTRVFALIPTPGFPALAFVHPDGKVYEGTYDNPSGSPLPSRVLEYTGEGTFLRSWTIEGQTLNGSHGVQVANTDAQGRLVLLDKSPARVLILDPRTGEQIPYSTFAELPQCSDPTTNGDGTCSPAAQDLTPFPDYAAWGPDGSLYVTDYQQAVIWRVPPGGGKAAVWLSDRRLDGNMFGTAGIALTADRSALLVSQASSAGGGEVTQSTGKLYRVPIGSDGKPGPMTKLWESRPTDAPDGFAIAKSGNVYVALAGPENQLAEVAPDGHEIERFPQVPFSGDNGSSVPFDTVSSAMFLGTRLMVANQSFEAGNTANQAILDVEVGEEGLPTYVPPNAGPPAPVAAKPKPKAKKKHKRRCRRVHGKRHCRRRS